jgi:hypothetical protein
VNWPRLSTVTILDLIFIFHEDEQAFHAAHVKLLRFGEKLIGLAMESHGLAAL